MAVVLNIFANGGRPKRDRNSASEPIMSVDEKTTREDIEFIRMNGPYMDTVNKTAETIATFLFGSPGSSTFTEQPELDRNMLMAELAGQIVMSTEEDWHDRRLFVVALLDLFQERMDLVHGLARRSPAR